MSSAQEPLLRVSSLEVAYGEIQVLWAVDLHNDRGEIVALVGSNGAGKTTLLRAIAGMIRPLRGNVCFSGASLLGLPASEIVGRGVSMVPEGRRLFAGLTVLQNLKMGAFSRHDREVKQDLDMVFGLFPKLYERRAQLGGTLSGGEQQMCAMARALMARPKLLLIDELSLGLAPVIVEGLMETVQRISRDGHTTVMLVDQDVLAALEISDRGYVLENGHITLGDRAETLVKDQGVRTAYLGL